MAEAAKHAWDIGNVLSKQKPSKEFQLDLVTALEETEKVYPNFRMQMFVAGKAFDKQEDVQVTCSPAFVKSLLYWGNQMLKSPHMNTEQRQAIIDMVAELEQKLT